MNDQENDKNQPAFSAGEAVNSPVFFIGIIHQGNDQQLNSTLASIAGQNYAPGQIDVYVFYKGQINLRVKLNLRLHFISFESEDEFYVKFISRVNNSRAIYCTVFKSGDCLFEQSLQMLGKTYEDFPEIGWITGIQTMQVASGFNIFFGSIATRRWSSRIFERNLYKNSGRYIPAGATFWKKSLWDKARPYLYFVLHGNFFEDLWQAFFKVDQLYTSNIYISSTAHYEARRVPTSTASIAYSLLQGGFMENVREFFFINNVPYLRLYYLKENNLVPVVRYDHKTQTCFLNDY